jgi:hypothetical protein
VRRNTPAVTGLRPLPIAPRPPVTDVLTGQTAPKRLEAGAGHGEEGIASGAAAVALPVRLSPVPLRREPFTTAAPIAVSVEALRVAPERERVASAHPAVAKGADPVTRRVSRELAPHRDAAVAAFETMTGRRPNAAHRSWTPGTGMQASLPVGQSARRLPVATQAAAAPRARPVPSGGR